MLDQQQWIRLTEDYVQQQLQHDSSGHDWWHIVRVRNMAVKLAQKEGADVFICELAALLHDVADEKLNPTKEAGLAKVNDWMASIDLDEAVQQRVMLIISTMSYNGGHNPLMETLEGMVVQDADRLDAIGAVGIARVFAYSGSRNRVIHDPGIEPIHFDTNAAYRQHQGTAINHFYEKLLKLKELMNTEQGKLMAASRHQYMVDYLARFYEEWDGRDT
ncbi:HD domain-containing protein [Paenibacillus sp. ACRRX]|uniref:HD domain-containing protein n=1 Tax=unclassified Paenibacillus TaxID=185978 RepID=UPI001EF4D892|nr:MULTISPECIES: HD domain-containing protein [unclassified Paenibacillus]MCG7407331.1 HD domain-containing protein [Paenibacillus sp. ACRRX]MDK8180557.1 HD domain-containing protein [Paenibacillus sp. UMB4589-SE434]